MPSSARETVRNLLSDAVSAAVGAAEIALHPTSIAVERPKQSDHGDYATNVALLIAKGSGKSPRAIADWLVARLPIGGSSPLAAASVAGPGFINLRLTDAYWQAALPEILGAANHWGRGAARSNPRISLEYLSANPTGPMHFAHGRHAAVGDSLARLLRFAGYPVTTEFYVNDAGNQVHVLALSVWARYMESARQADPSVPAVPFPDNGYKGAYIREFGKELLARDGDRHVSPLPPTDLEPIKRFAIDRCLGIIRATLKRFDVDFDSWQSERALHDSGEVQATLASLEAGGFIERREDAVWLKTTTLWGDDKDRVVVKSDGLPTYLLADIAYHRKKIAAGNDELCDIWGADHHGHIAKMRAALKAFGYDPDVLRVVLIQMVSLIREGKPVAMGKREGEFVTLDEVLGEVGRDATRFFYLMRRHDTPLEFDLELAKRQSMDNPVYYVQYAHARCRAILRRATELEAPRSPVDHGLAERLTLPEEIDILKRLVDFPDFVADAAAAHEPHRLTTFMIDLAGAFQSYYTQLQKVHGDTILPQERHRAGAADWRAGWDWRKTDARLHWVEAISQVMRNGLTLLGVAAPEVMSKTEDRTDNLTKEEES
jgi:arginyl-tRNA synthetase